MDFKKLEVDFFSKNYEMLRSLGSGSFGSTYLCLNNMDDKLYAVKIIPCTEDKTKNVLKQCKAMSNFKHPNIVYYHTAWMEAGVPRLAKKFLDDSVVPDPMKNETATRTVFIVMRHYPRVLFREIQEGVLTEDEVYKIFYGLAKALALMHESGWIHCDVHPGNIFLDNSGEPKLADSGLSRKIGEDDKELGIGHGLYQPMEVFAQDLHTPASDMFSFALCMIEVSCSLKSEEREIIFDDAKAGLLPGKLIEKNDVIFETVQQILNATHPRDRMKASDILEQNLN